MDWFTPEVQQSLGANWNYFHILNDVLPPSGRPASARSQIRAMTVENPRRIFETWAATRHGCGFGRPTQRCTEVAAGGRMCYTARVKSFPRPRTATNIPPFRLALDDKEDQTP